MAVPVVKLQDPQLDIVERNYYAKVGASDVTYQIIKAISNTDSQLIFNTTTPSVNVGLSRRMKVGLPIRVKTNVSQATSPGPVTNPFLLTTFNGTEFGLRAYPLAAVTENLSLKLNNSTINTNLNDIIHAMMEFGTSPDERNKWRSGEPSYPDQFDYVSYFNALAPPAFITDGARNTFSSYPQNVLECSRNIKNYAVNIQLCDFLISTGPDVYQTHVVSFDLYFVSDVFVSPLNWTEKDCQALFGIQTIDLTIVMSNLRRIFSISANATEVPSTDISQWFINVQTDTKASLYLSYLSPQINMPVSKLLHYPYYDVNRYISSQSQPLAGSTCFAINTVVASPMPANGVAPVSSFLGKNPLTSLTTLALAGGASNKFYVDNITLHAIPKRLYIFCTKDKNLRISDALNYIRSDTYAAITGISINWNNRAGVLSSADCYQLYAISVRNGLDMTYFQWLRAKGSVLCLEPSVDIPLTAVQSPGTRGNYQISYSINVNSVCATSNPSNYQVYTVAVQEGFMTINDSVIALDVGVLTEQSVLDAPFAPAGTFNAITHMYGGGFWGDMWRGVKKGARYVRDIGTKGAKVIGDVAGALSDVPGIGVYARPVADVANAVHGVGKAVGGRRKRAGSRSGGYLSGGRRMSQRSLSRRVR